MALSVETIHWNAVYRRLTDEGFLKAVGRFHQWTSDRIVPPLLLSCQHHIGHDFDASNIHLRWP